jgi:hypothetical protein
VSDWIGREGREVGGREATRAAVSFRRARRSAGLVAETHMKSQQIPSMTTPHSMARQRHATVPLRKRIVAISRFVNRRPTTVYSPIVHLQAAITAAPTPNASASGE